MSIRSMTMDDYEKVYELWVSCAGMGLNTLDDSKAGIERFLQRNPDTCFVAEAEGVVVGVILVGNDGRRGYIYHTAVDPHYRRQGIAEGLVDRAMTALQKIGIHKTALVVFDRNRIGNDFWEKMGFTVRNDLVYRNKALTELVRVDT